MISTINVQLMNFAMTWLVYRVKREFVNALRVLIGKIKNAVNLNYFKSFQFSYLNNFNFTLDLLSSFSQKCSGNEECDLKKNLSCSDAGKCQCISSTLFWSEKNSTCSKDFFLRIK